MQVVRYQIDVLTINMLIAIDVCIFWLSVKYIPFDKKGPAGHQMPSLSVTQQNVQSLFAKSIYFMTF